MSHQGSAAHRDPLSAVDENVDSARVQAAEDGRLSTNAALFQLKEATLKATFKQQLRGLLEEVSEEQDAHQKLRSQHHDLSKRFDALSSELSSLRLENKSLQAQLEQSQAQTQQTFLALQTAETEAREKGYIADTAQSILEEEGRRRKDEGEAARMREEVLAASQRQALEQVQKLMGQLADRDRQVAQLDEELLAAQSVAKSAQSEVQRLDALSRSLGERLAASETAGRTRTEGAAQLQQELSALRERYLGDLSELKALKVECQEAARLREQLTAAQGMVSVLIEAREELRGAVTQLTARLAAEQERVRRMETATSIRDLVVQVLEGLPEDLDPEGVVESVCDQLDQALKECEAQGARAAALDAACAQHEAHMRRLSSELGDRDRELQSREEHMHTLQRMVAELQAELQRLSAQQALGPPVVLRQAAGPGTTALGDDPRQQGGSAVVVGQAGEAGREAQSVASALETCCTAVRVALADKGFAARALSKRLNTKASMPLDGLMAKQRLVQADTTDLVCQLDDLSVCLSTRPLDASLIQGTLTISQDKLRALVAELTERRDELLRAQSELVSCESSLCEAELPLKQCGAVLSGWVSLAARRATDGEVLDEALRVQLREELQTVEATLSRGVAQVSSGVASGGVAAGDSGVASVEAGVRAAQGVLLDLAARLPERELLSDAKLKAAVISAEIAVREQLGVVGRVRAAVAGGPQACALLAGEVAAVVVDVSELLGRLEELEEAVKKYLQAGRDVPVDPVALQGEVLALRSQLRDAQRSLAQMESAKGVIRPAQPTGTVRGLVPTEALDSSERARAALQEELARLHGTLTQQRLRHSTARTAFVGYYAQLRQDCLLRLCWSAWCSEVAQSKVQHTERLLAEVTGEQQRLGAVCSHHRAVVASVLSRMLGDSDTLLGHRALLLWRLETLRKRKVRNRWKNLVSQCQEVITRAEGALPQWTVAQRLAARQLSLWDPWQPPVRPRSDLQVLGLLWGGWRSWVRMKRRSRQVATLSAGMPALVSAVGTRRRKERAWLGWRLAVVDELVARANALLLRAGQKGVGRHARHSSSGAQDSPGSSVQPTPRTTVEDQGLVAIPSLPTISELLPNHHQHWDYDLSEPVSYAQYPASEPSHQHSRPGSQLPSRRGTADSATTGVAAHGLGDGGGAAPGSRGLLQEERSRVSVRVPTTTINSRRKSTGISAAPTRSATQPSSIAPPFNLPITSGAQRPRSPSELVPVTHAAPSVLQSGATLAQWGQGSPRDHPPLSQHRPVMVYTAADRSPQRLYAQGQTTGAAQHGSSGGAADTRLWVSHSDRVPQVPGHGPPQDAVEDSSTWPAKIPAVWPHEQVQAAAQAGLVSQQPVGQPGVPAPASLWQALAAMVAQEVARAGATPAQSNAAALPTSAVQVPPHQQAYLPYVHTLIDNTATQPSQQQAQPAPIPQPLAPAPTAPHSSKGVSQPFQVVGPYLRDVLVQDSVFEPRFAGAAPPEVPSVASGGVRWGGQHTASNAVPQEGEDKPAWRSPRAMTSPSRQATTATAGTRHDAGSKAVRGASKARESSSRQVTQGTQRLGTAARPASVAGHARNIQRATQGAITQPAPAPSSSAQLVARAQALEAAVDSLAEGLRGAVAAVSPRRQVAVWQQAKASISTQQQQPPNMTVTTSNTAEDQGGRSSPQRSVGGASTLLQFDPALTDTASGQAATLRKTGAPDSGPETSHTRPQQSQVSTASCTGPSLSEPPAEPTAAPALMIGPLVPHETTSSHQKLPSSSAPVSHAHTEAVLQRAARVLGTHGSTAPHTYSPPARATAGSAVAVTEGPGLAAKTTSSKQKYAHVPSRLHEETVATRSKRVGQGLPGGLANLTDLAAPTRQPVMAPLSTYTAPAQRSSTPGPVGAGTVVSGGLRGGLPGYVESVRPDMTLAAFSAVYGPDRAAGRMTVPVGMGSRGEGGTQVRSGGQEARTQPSAADQQQDTVQLGPDAAAVKAAFDNVRGTGNLLLSRKSGSPRQQGLHQSTGMQVKVYQQPTATVASTTTAYENGHLAVAQQEPRAAPHVVRFERPGLATATAAGLAATATVTVRLPAPVRFNLTQ